MTRAAAADAATAGRSLSGPLARRFEAIIFDWDGAAAPDRQATAAHVRVLVEEACAAGLELAVVSGTQVDDLDGQLAARPSGAGELLLVPNRGSEVFRVDREGPQLAYRRTASPEGAAALAHAAQIGRELLAPCARATMRARPNVARNAVTSALRRPALCG